MHLLLLNNALGFLCQDVSGWGRHCGIKCTSAFLQQKIYVLLMKVVTAAVPNWSHKSYRRRLNGIWKPSTVSISTDTNWHFHSWVLPRPTISFTLFKHLQRQREHYRNTVLMLAWRNLNKVHKNKKENQTENNSKKEGSRVVQYFATLDPSLLNCTFLPPTLLTAFSTITSIILT